MEIQTDNPNSGYPFPCFSYDKINAIVLNTAYIMCSKTIDVRYILAVLNSSVGKVLTKLYVTQLQQRQYRMLAQYVCNFPIPKASKEQMSYLIQLADNQINNQTAEIDIVINEEVSKLYGFSKEEINFIQSQQNQ